MLACSIVRRSLVFGRSRCHVGFLRCLHPGPQCRYLSLKRIDDALLPENNVAQIAIRTFKERELGFDPFECVVVHDANSFISLTSVTLTVITGVDSGSRDGRAPSPTPGALCHVYGHFCAGIHCCSISAASAAAAASLCVACHGGPIDRPIADRKELMSWGPITAAASRNTRSRSYQCTDQPRSSAALARAWRYMTESATFAARVSAIRSSVVGGSLGHTRMAMLAIGTGSAATSSSRLSRAPRSAAK